ncbi:MAG: tRNA (N(6)-L-threonylcarbamoyladenosine(37)-C(2))-methylthiotransferase MtaB [Bacteroidetes bacterium]|nr:tRNA (N(6)-L-threonylcarbamoyladenosine(37)-C(2))-methylthiotransferase MtaB [Bacteroidota bacterium]
MTGKVALHTLGCKLNFSESSTIGKQFIDEGFEIVDFKQRADIYVFNTCAVTGNAERECRQLVRRVLRDNPNAYIIITGCYAQLRPNEIGEIKGVDIVLGNSEKLNLFSYLENFDKSEFACIKVGSLEDINEFGEARSTDADSRTRAYFKIQDGCDYKCTFCTIPLARGRSRSMHPQSAIADFRKLIDDGYKEIILTGVNVGDYGKAFGIGLYDLLLDFVKIDGDFRIRISSIEPNLLTDEIINLIAEEKKICSHLHIPLQSGSPNILKAMQRRYTVKEYENRITKAVENIEDLGVGVDVIVGFPGETEEQFIETHNFLRDLPISYLHVFTYSERPDTKAIKLSNTVEIVERKRRNKVLRILSNKKKNQFHNRMLGRKLEVLFEGGNAAGSMQGYTSNYIRVVHDFEKSSVNKILNFEITGITDDGLCSGIFKVTNKSIEFISSIS